jgi:hypothetical protein
MVVASDTPKIGCNCRAPHPPEALFWSPVLGRVTENHQLAASQAKRSVLILGAVQPLAIAYSRAISEFRSRANRGQQGSPSAACSDEAGGPRLLSFGRRPGITWGCLLYVRFPVHAVSKALAVKVVPSESVPRGARAVSRKLSPRHIVVSTHDYNRAEVRLVPSESVPRGVQAVSAPRPQQRLAHPTCKPSRATSAPVSGPRDPIQARLSAPAAAIRPPSVVGLRPALFRAPATAPQRPPGYRSRPRPVPPQQGLQHWPTKESNPCQASDHELE